MNLGFETLLRLLYSTLDAPIKKSTNLLEMKERLNISLGLKKG